jgi:putative redox protein
MRKVVSQFGEGPLQQKLTTGDLHHVSDAELSKGGDGTGPSPHEYLGAALAACTSMTLKMYSERKSIPLKNAIVTVDIERQNDIEIFTLDKQLPLSSQGSFFRIHFFLKRKTNFFLYPMQIKDAFNGIIFTFGNNFSAFKDDLRIFNYR